MLDNVTGAISPEYMPREVTDPNNPNIAPGDESASVRSTGWSSPDAGCTRLMAGDRHARKRSIPPWCHPITQVPKFGEKQDLSLIFPVIEWGSLLAMALDPDHFKQCSEKETSERVTSLLIEWGRGNRAALDELVPLLYDELRRLAAYYLSRERPEHTLGATALVHEAYMRLVSQSKANVQTRAQFFQVAAHVMRCVLVDYARTRNAGKRRPGTQKLPLEAAEALAQERDLELIALDDALKSLTAIDPEKGRIVELRFFGGLSVEEVAETLGESPRSVARKWAVAKAWLYEETRSP